MSDQREQYERKKNARQRTGSGDGAAMLTLPPSSRLLSAALTLFLLVCSLSSRLCSFVDHGPPFAFGLPSSPFGLHSSRLLSCCLPSSFDHDNQTKPEAEGTCCLAELLSSNCSLSSIVAAFSRRHRPTTAAVAAFFVLLLPPSRQPCDPGAAGYTIKLAVSLVRSMMHLTRFQDSELLLCNFRLSSSLGLRYWSRTRTDLSLRVLLKMRLHDMIQQ
ncbi:uncharacterized protein LOC116252145 [Nymphaea colorata]|uniref:uncharacterized protein LOC116252145 n=1 Tax=Nymphaea colorata TaxID=210225 RepID=UPI00214E1614|nr:uncharacterized protein LOC116252145 [Nymphaea colorata]